MGQNNGTPTITSTMLALWACLLLLMGMMMGGGAWAGQNNGTATGSPTYAADAGFGQALVFNGTSQLLQAPTNAQGWGANGSWTLEGRVKTVAAVLQVAVSVLKAGDATTPAPNVWMGAAANGHAEFSVNGFGGAIDSGVAINDNAFHSVAIDCSMGVTLRCFVDGVLTNTVSGQMVGITGASLYIGELGAVSGSGFNFGWTGSVDEVAVSDTCLYTASYTPATAPLANNRASQGQISLYHLDGDVTDAAVPSFIEGDGTGPAYGQPTMFLFPSSSAPYVPPASGPPLILYCHGAGETERALLTDGLKWGCVQAFLNAGYIVCGSAAHGTNNWGNQASVDDYADLYHFAASNYNSTNCLLWGQSMGGLDSLSVLSQGKVPNVVGWLGTYPVCSLNAVYTGAGGGANFSSVVNTAYSITGSGTATYANLTYGLDPLLKWGNAFRCVPMRFYASPNDVVVGKSANTDPFAALVAGSSREHAVIACTGNHGDPSHFQPSDYLAFAARCFASPVATSGPVFRPQGSRPAPKGGH